jgi:hypothetical protein
MKVYVCDEYHFYWHLSNKRKEEITKQLQPKGRLQWVPVCAWNILYSIYDSADENTQIAEVRYRSGERYDNPDKY